MASLHKVAELGGRHLFLVSTGAQVILMLLIGLSDIIYDTTFWPANLWTICKHLMVTVASYDVFKSAAAACRIGHE